VEPVRCAQCRALLFRAAAGAIAAAVEIKCRRCGAINIKAAPGGGAAAGS
jgi:phage FluMu protein Com